MGLFADCAGLGGDVAPIWPCWLAGEVPEHNNLREHGWQQGGIGVCCGACFVLYFMPHLRRDSAHRRLSQPASGGGLTQRLDVTRDAELGQYHPSWTALSPR
ncbi:MAG: hypothetical protein U1E47_06700 [Rivihabitans pingtungensis]